MDSPIFLRGLVRAFNRRSAWLTAACATILLALFGALPWFGATSRMIDHHYQPGSLVRELDETFRIDNRVALDALNAQGRASAAGLAFLAMLVGAFCAGGWLSLFTEDRRGSDWIHFCRGGARYFWRFVRLLVLTLLSFQLIGWLVYDDPWKSIVQEKIVGVTDLEQLKSELSMRILGWTQDALYLALFALILAWGDVTRTRMARIDSSSAIASGLRTWATIFERPVFVLRPLVLITAIELAVMLLAGVARHWVEAPLGADSGIAPILLLAAITAAVIGVRSILRGARYSASLETWRALEPELDPDSSGASR